MRIKKTKILALTIIMILSLCLGGCMQTNTGEVLSPIDLSTPAPVKPFVLEDEVEPVFAEAELPDEDEHIEQYVPEIVEEPESEPLSISSDIELSSESEEVTIVPRGEPEYGGVDIEPVIIDGTSPTTGLAYPTEESAADLLEAINRMKDRNGTIYNEIISKLLNGDVSDTESPQIDVSEWQDPENAIDAFTKYTPYLPVMVQIPNAGSARPQWNIQLADIVYETIIASGDYTRLTAIYHDNLPDHTGPVRSTRLMHWDIRQEWDIPFAYYGGQRKEGTSIYDYQKQLNVRLFWDGINDTSGVFTRDSSRSAPDNAYVNIKDLVSRYTYEATPRTFFFRSTPPYDGEREGVKVEAVSSFTIPYRKGDEVRYDWDAENGYYLRYAGGREFLDGTTMEQVHVTNVIIQKAKHSLYANHNERMLVELIGTGEAEYFIGGQHFIGTWSREDVNSRTIYYDETGVEISLMPGTTWIQLMRHNSEVTDIVYADAGESVQ